MAVVLPPFQLGDVRRVRAIWTAPSGEDIHLTDCPGGIDWLKGRGGGDMPLFEQLEDDVVDGDGAEIRGVRALPRTYLMPIAVKGEDFDAWRALEQRVLQLFNPLSGDGRLTIVQPDDTRRILTCRYAGGAEGDSIVDPGGRYWYRIWALKLRAVDPWWYATEPTTVTFGAPGTLPFFPLLPVHLSRSQVLGEATINLVGHVRTWGVWTIHGPANGPAVLRSETQGRQLTLDLTGEHELAAGQTVTVDMRPGRQGVRGPDGSPWWSARVGNPEMWELQPGTNTIRLEVAGGDTTTRVEFSYTPRYLTE